jgi:hypothetical protein
MHELSDKVDARRVDSIEVQLYKFAQKDVVEFLQKEVKTKANGDDFDIFKSKSLGTHNDLY